MMTNEELDAIFPLPKRWAATKEPLKVSVEEIVEMIDEARRAAFRAGAEAMLQDVLAHVPQGAGRELIAGLPLPEMKP